ncbi:MAG: OsmC family protein [Gammaproteobacteria bacterium]|nr:OsmC family protein [Gammaproteobacteria bacterium]
MIKPHHYRALLRWTGSRFGPISDYASYSREYEVHIAGKVTLKGSADALFKGDAGLHNPEDWLVAALSACHLLSYLALCGREGIAVYSYEDGAEGTMVLEGGGGHFTEVVLRPKVVVGDGADLQRAIELHDIAHHQCFIAASMNFPVRHDASVEMQRASGTDD